MGKTRPRSKYETQYTAEYRRCVIARRMGAIILQLMNVHYGMSLREIHAAVNDEVEKDFCLRTYHRDVRALLLAGEIELVKSGDDVNYRLGPKWRGHFRV